MCLGRRGMEENVQLKKTIKKKKRQREQCNNYHYFPWTSQYSALRIELILNCNLVMFSSMSPIQYNAGVSLQKTANTEVENTLLK